LAENLDIAVEASPSKGNVAIGTGKPGSDDGSICAEARTPRAVAAQELPWNFHEMSDLQK